MDMNDMFKKVLTTMGGHKGIFNLQPGVQNESPNRYRLTLELSDRVDRRSLGAEFRANPTQCSLNKTQIKFQIRHAIVLREDWCGQRVGKYAPVHSVP